MGFFSDIAPVAMIAGGVATGNPQLALSGIGMMGANQQGGAAQQGNLQAAQSAMFKPIGITNTFGTSNFGYNDQGGLTSAGYSLSPNLQTSQNLLMGNLSTSLTDQTNIANMGRSYMALTPQEQAQQYITNQQALLQPSRDKALANLGTQNYNQGTTGLSVAQGGTLEAANPYATALANAQAMQDLQLAANATQAGQQQYLFGQGLLSSSYQPYTANLSASGATEALGQQPFTLSSGLAGNTALAGNNAAPYLQAAGSYSPTGNILSGLAQNQQFGKGLSNLFGGSSFGSPSDYGNILA